MIKYSAVKQKLLYILSIIVLYNSVQKIGQYRIFCSYIVLHTVVLHCIALHCIILFSIVELRCIIFYSIIEYSIALYSTVLHYIVQYCIKQDIIEQYTFLLYSTQSSYITFHLTAPISSTQLYNEVQGRVHQCKQKITK